MMEVGFRVQWSDLERGALSIAITSRNTREKKRARTRQPSEGEQIVFFHRLDEYHTLQDSGERQCTSWT